MIGLAHIRNRAGALLLPLAGAYCAGLALVLGLRLVMQASWWWVALLDNFVLYLFGPLLLVLPLAGLLRQRWLGGAALALSVIGLVWLGGAARLDRPPIPPAHASKPLKVVVYNLRDDGRDIAPDVDWLLGSAADVIFISEVRVAGADARLARLKQAYPYEVRQEFDQRIFARYALQAGEMEWLEAPALGRIVIKTGLEFEGRRLSLYSVHTSVPEGEAAHFDVNRFPFRYLPLRNYFGHVLLHYDETRRNAQLEQLLKIVRADPNPVIVAGDFNLSPYSAEYTQMAAELQDTHAAAGSGLGHTWPSNVVIGAPQWLPALLRIDYIWHSAEFVTLSHRVAGPLGSDHLPLMAVLAWE